MYCSKEKTHRPPFSRNQLIPWKFRRHRLPNHDKKRRNDLAVDVVITFFTLTRPRVQLYRTPRAATISNLKQKCAPPHKERIGGRTRLGKIYPNTRESNLICFHVCMRFARLFQFERSIDVWVHCAISAGVNPFLKGYFRSRNCLKIVSFNSSLNSSWNARIKKESGWEKEGNEPLMKPQWGFLQEPEEASIPVLCRPIDQLFKGD